MKWEYKTLDELGVVSRGKSKHRPRSDKALFGGEYPFIQTADVKKADLYITEYQETYNEFGLAQSKLWKEGTLCITIAANIADTAILKIPACFPDSIMGFVPYDGVADVKFVKYCFDVLQRDCKNISQGTAQDNLSWEKLSTIKFYVPDYDTQKRIASILSAYDSLIENNQKQIKLLEEAAQRLYKEWFVDLRFPGHEDVEFVDGLPVGWECCLLSEIADVKAGGDRPIEFSKAKAEMFGVPIYSNGIDEEGLYGYTDKAVVDVECVTISARGTVGVAFYRDTPFVPIVRLLTVIPTNRVDAIFLYHLLKNTTFSSNGAAQQQLTIPMLEKTEIILPPAVIVERYSVFAKELFIKRKSLKVIIDKLAEARERLLPKLMSREVVV